MGVYLREFLVRKREVLGQRLFNPRTLASKRHLQLLEELTDAALRGRSPVNAMNLLTYRYGGYRWAGHPRREAHLQELNAQLSILADTGEVERQQGGDYRVTGQAKRALEDAREEDRRHRANFLLQRVLALLTAATVLTGLVQANVVKLPTILDQTESQEKRVCAVAFDSHVMERVEAAARAELDDLMRTRNSAGGYVGRCDACIGMFC